jgi:pimeloyl-ACP methyl ester carboxylesterase
LHGTGELFAPLLPLIDPILRPKVICYPTDQRLGYDELLALIEDELIHEPQVILLAESFSGPLAIRYAARHSQQVRAVVLCATFIRTPLWPTAVALFSCFVRSPPPKLILRWLLAGRDADRSTCRWVQTAIAQVQPAVIAHRLKQVQRLDVSDELSRCVAPILYLQARDDCLVRPHCLSQMLGVEPNMHVETLRGPHMLLQIFPNDAWRCIARFLVSVGEVPSDARID